MKPKTGAKIRPPTGHLLGRGVVGGGLGGLLAMIAAGAAIIVTINIIRPTILRSVYTSLRRDL